jgi:putative transposase
MATDPDTSLPPNSASDSLPAEIAQALAGGLGDYSLRELLSLMLTSLGRAERQKYLARTPADKGNGAYSRSLQVGSIPIDIDVPRTRNGTFRPTVLPPLYQRDYPEETQALLLALLASSRSVNAAKTALRRLGLSGSEQDIDSVAHEFIEELQLRNSRPLDPDLLALFLDAKYLKSKRPIACVLAPSMSWLA